MSLKLDKLMLDKLGFREIPIEENPFKYLQMPYFVKDSVLLFYNEGEINKNDFLLGYGEMREGVYHAVGIKWIHTVGELQDFYQVVKGKVLVSLL